MNKKSETKIWLFDGSYFCSSVWSTLSKLNILAVAWTIPSILSNLSSSFLNTEYLGNKVELWTKYGEKGASIGIGSKSHF